MGTDKALIRLPDGRRLWEAQLALLAALRPAALYISGRPEQAPTYKNTLAAPFIPDAVAECGPLGGISTLLAQMPQSHLLVLAVDLVYASPLLLETAYQAISGPGGHVFLKDSYFEPLAAAIYPKDFAPLAEECLSKGNFGLQDVLHRAVELGWMQATVLPEILRPSVVNWNTDPTSLP
jgi:molybdopterin-guanine dinucleotide biosynthesis protein A